MHIYIYIYKLHFYVCIHICIYVCIYICIRSYTIFTNSYAYIYVCMYIQTNPYIHLKLLLIITGNILIRICIQIFTCIFVCICISTCIHICAYTHVHISCLHIYISYEGYGYVSTQTILVDAYMRIYISVHISSYIYTYIYVYACIQGIHHRINTVSACTNIIQYVQPQSRVLCAQERD